MKLGLKLGKNHNLRSGSLSSWVCIWIELTALHRRLNWNFLSRLQFSFIIYVSSTNSYMKKWMLNVRGLIQSLTLYMIESNSVIMMPCRHCNGRTERWASTSVLIFFRIGSYLTIWRLSDSLLSVFVCCLKEWDVHLTCSMSLS